MDKLEIINSIKVTESDSDGESLYWVNVENNEENREKLMSLGVSESELSEMIDSQEETIDISQIGFTYTNAKWFQESLGGFIDYVPDHAPDSCK